MNLNEKEEGYSWENLETTTLVLPGELLVYYLYRHGLDTKTKHTEAVKDDTYLINRYAKKLNMQKEETINVLKNN